MLSVELSAKIAKVFMVVHMEQDLSYLKSKQPWMHISDKLPQYHEQPDLGLLD